MDTKRLASWNSLIYDVYAGSRLQMIKGFFKSGSIQLSYVMEYQMKFLGGLCGIKLKNQNKHKLTDIYNELVEEGVLDRNLVTVDFLEYASFWFNRYPSQIVGSFEKWLDTYGGIAMDVTTVSYYDDFTCILNDMIVEKSSDVNNCLFTRALQDYDSYQSRVIFHNNYHALSQYGKYMERLEKRNPSIYGIVRKEMDEQVFVEYKELGSSWGFRELSISKIAEIKKVSRFHLPTKGNPTWTL